MIGIEVQQINFQIYGMIKIDDLLSKVLKSGFANQVERIGSHEVADMDMEIELIRRIGLMRCRGFAIDSTNRFAYENAVRWLSGDVGMRSLNISEKTTIAGDLLKGLYVAGGVGSGKSMFLEVMSAYSSIRGYMVKVGSHIVPLNWRCIRTDAVCDEFTRHGSIEKYKNAPLLCLQDVGAEPLESLYMGNRVNVIRQVLENRGDRDDCITIISSNLPFNHRVFVERYGERCSSRLYKMCNYLIINGKDRRKE